MSFRPFVLLLVTSLRTLAQNSGEPGVFTMTKPEHSAEEVRAAYAEMPPVIYTAPADRWRHLAATMAALESGGLRVVMLGDSIVNGLKLIFKDQYQVKTGCRFYGDLG